jgi:small subunit ribosomal protein S1
MDSTPTAATLRPGAAVTGTVTHVTLYGAIIDMGDGQSGLLHLSQMGNADFRNVEDVITAGQTYEAYVLKVDPKTNHVVLTTVKPPELPWDAIKIGETYKGKVVRLEKFGAFVDIGAERPGMVHISEMTNSYVKSPEDVVKVGDEVDARVMKVNRKKRQIDLSMKPGKSEVQEAYQQAAQVQESSEPVPTAMEMALRRARAMSESSKGASREYSNTPTRKPRREREDRDMEQDDMIRRTLRSNMK